MRNGDSFDTRRAVDMEGTGSGDPVVSARLSRRQVLRYGLASTAGLFLLSACAPSAPSSPAGSQAAPAAIKPTADAKPAAGAPTTSPAKPAEAAKPAADAKPTSATQPATPAAKAGPTGGTLTLILDQEPPHLDVQTFVARVTIFVGDSIHEYLCAYDVDAKIVPSLATGWEYLDDKTVKFTLHQGVKFHNGRELVAEDVKKSVERVMDPTTGSPLRGQLGPLDRVEAPDKYTAVFHLKTPFAFLFDKLCHLAIYPQDEIDAGKDPKTQPVGAGPFRFKEWKRDQYIELERFPDYFKPGLPKVDRLIFRPITNYGSARSTFLAREGDVMLTVSGADVEPFKAMPDVKLHRTDIIGFTLFGFNLSREPWNNVKVRQAVKYAIDRQAIIQGALQGHGVPAFAPTPPDSPYYTKDVENERDIEKAKQLMAEAGYASGFEDTMIASSAPSASLPSDMLQSQLAEIGIRLKLEKMESTTVIDRMFNKRDQSMAMVGVNAPDISRLLDPYLRPDGPNNFTHYNNPKMVELLDKGSATIDDAERAKTYQDILRLMSDEVPMIYLFSPLRYTAAYNWVDNLTLKRSLQQTYEEATTTKQ